VNSNRTRNIVAILIVMFFMGYLLVSWYNNQQASIPTIPLSQVAQEIQDGKIQQIIVVQDDLEIHYEGDQQAKARKESTSALSQQLESFGVTPAELDKVKIEIQAPNDWGLVFNLLSYLLPVLVLGVFIYFMVRQMQGTNNQAIMFGKSKARMLSGDQPTVTFEDVAGVEEAKEELHEVVEFLKEPEKFISLGARIPKGVLLVGSPGTGKTLMAKAVSGEAGVPFFSISGSEFVEMFVGVGASRVRDLFEQAKRHSPCIVFVDEIDAVGRQRGTGLGGSHDEREQTLNQILVEMDGFDTDTNVIVMAATNRPDILDPALLRPGRFDRRVVLDRPDMRGREAILKVHVRGKPLAPGVDLVKVAKGTPGFVGADLENLVNEAAILAARRNKKSIGQEEFQESVERVIAGPERKSRLITDAEKKIIANHEAGHAVVMQAIPESDPVHKVSIISRGMMGGYTLALPEEDRTVRGRREFMAELAGLLGGRAAEEIVFNDITTGASSDMERATKTARNMVTRWGMSDRLGPMVYGQKEELIFLGREISEQRDYSDQVANVIDEEVRKIVNSAYEEAKTILTKHRDVLERVASRLVEIETIDEDEFNRLFPAPQPKRSGTPIPRTK
jgi:cell division protease FtsH